MSVNGDDGSFGVCLNGQICEECCGALEDHVNLYV